MAKKYTESDIKRQLAARQGRGPGGRFLPLSPEQRLSAIRASKINYSSEEDSSPSDAPTIGMASAAGQASPIMISAATLLREAKNLSIDAEFAESQEAKQIYDKIQVIRKLAKRSEISATVLRQLDDAIKPVEEQLRKKASFAEFVKDRIQQFRKTLPERLVSNIPVVGGILGGFLRQRRESLEQMGEYERQLLRRGSAGGGSVGSGFGGGGRGMLGGMGGLAERERQFETTKAAAFPTKTIEAIYKEVVAIRKSVDRIAKVSVGGSSSILDSLKNRFFGRRSRIGRLFRRGRIGARRLMRGLRRSGGRVASTLGRAMGSVGRTIGRVAGTVGGGISRVAGTVGGGISRVAGTVGSGIGKAAGTVGGGISRVAGTVGSVGGGWLSSAWNATKGFAGKAVGAAKNLGGKALGTIAELNPLKALSSAVKSSAPKLGKALMSAPGVAALLTTAIRSINISGIKNDPSLTADQKKEEIGKQITGLLGGVLGSVGGGVLAGTVGSVIPIAGTSVGALLGSAGGAWLGGWLGEQLGDALGGKNIYDLASSIPVIKSLISVGEEPKAPETVGAEGSIDSTTSTASSQNRTTSVTGTISAPATANTTVGKMANQYAAEQDALQNATASVMSGPPSNPTVNTANVRSNITNNINNFNDDLRIRNNEPTIRTMQAASHVF